MSSSTTTGTTTTKGQQKKLMFLEKGSWSPRYDETFYSVTITSKRRLTQAPSSSSSTAAAAAAEATRLLNKDAGDGLGDSTPRARGCSSSIRMGGKTNHPAFYYELIVYRSHYAQKTLWRRFSQFQWLYRQIQATAVANTTALSAQAAAVIIISPEELAEFQAIEFPTTAGTCPCCYFYQSEAFAAHRQAELGTFLSRLLARPWVASHPAVIEFLKLDDDENDK